MLQLPWPGACRVGADRCSESIFARHNQCNKGCSPFGTDWTSLRISTLCKLLDFCGRYTSPFEQRWLAVACIQQSHHMLLEHFIIKNYCRSVLIHIMLMSSTSAVRVFSVKMCCQRGNHFWIRLSCDSWSTCFAFTQYQKVILILGYK